MYADVDGTIAYQCTGWYPLRDAGDGTRPVPGWTGEHEWLGWIPLDELPAETNPDGGFIATANHDIQPAGYPYVIAKDFHLPFRKLRIEELLERHDRHDVATMWAIQVDTISRPSLETVSLLLRIETRSDEQASAVKLLGAWDGDLRADSVEAALFNLWCAAIARRALEPKMGEELFSAYHSSRETFQGSVLPRLLREPAGWLDDDLLRAGLDDAIERADRRTWGEIHRLLIAHPLASIPGLEPLFTAADIPFGGDEQTVAQGGFDGSLGFRPGSRGPRAEPRRGPDRGERQPGLRPLERPTRALPRGRGEAVRLRPAPDRAHVDASPILSRYHRMRHAEVERSPQAAEQPLPAGAATEEEEEGEPTLVRAPHARADGHRRRRDRLELHARRSGQQHGPDGRARSDRDRVLRRHVLEVISAPIGTERLPRRVHASFIPCG